MDHSHSGWTADRGPFSVLITLATHLENHPDEWENNDAGPPTCTRWPPGWGMPEGFYRNIRKSEVPEFPGWQLIAAMLRAGRA